MRYLPHTPACRAEMLKEIGVSSVDALYSAVPGDALLSGGIASLPSYKGEQTVRREISTIAAKNRPASSGPFFLGAGAYYHFIPAAVDTVLQRGEFLTSYTPYQPEVSQGTLAAIFQFQTYIANITGMDVANASMYEGATAVAEAALMARRVTRKNNVAVASRLHPDSWDTLHTYLAHQEGEILSLSTPTGAAENLACVIVQLPDYHGEIADLSPWRAFCDKTGALLIVATTEILAFGLLPAPEEADIVAGEARSIGVPLSYGGPYLGFFACKEKYLRQMPGRLCGETLDTNGNRSYVLTLNTREQHIRRDKATSNICTNEGLCALAFTVHMSLLGEEGFKKLALLNHQRACWLAAKLEAAGMKLKNTTFFNEFAVHLNRPAKDVLAEAAKEGITAGLALDKDTLLLAATEMTSEEDISALLRVLAA